MSVRNVIREGLEIGDALVVGLQRIEKLTHFGGEKADAALAAIRGVIEALQAGLGAELDAELVRSKMDELHDAIAKGDAETLAKIRARFAK